jgi:alginate O-acetyltransferase complex protein AlgI
LNLLIVFLVSGLWHGASWTFVIWGGLHGLYLIASLWLSALAEKIQRVTKIAIKPNKYLQIAITFGLVSFAWIFFRATSVADALYIVGHLFDNLGIITNFQALENSVLLGLGRTGFTIALLAIIGMELVQLVQRGGSVRAQLARQPALVRWSAYYLLVITILLLGVYGSRQFIYFQF